ncbi:MAG: RDD family protein, partial [Solirubrobacterales bacterium]
KSKRGKKAKAPKAPKQGKSFADMLLGEAKPGEQRKLFGVKIGAPGAVPGEAAVPPAAPLQPVAAPYVEAPVAEPFAAPIPDNTLPPAPLPEQQVAAAPNPPMALPPVAPQPAEPYGAADAVAQPAPPAVDPAAMQIAAAVPPAPVAAPLPQPPVIEPPAPVAQPAPQEQINPFAAVPAPVPAAAPVAPAPGVPAPPSPFAGVPAAAALPQHAPAPVGPPVPMGNTGPLGVTPPMPNAPVYKLADWGRRVGAAIIDGFVIGAIFYALAMVTGIFGPGSQGFQLTALLLYLAVISGYSGGMLTYNKGQTFGKRAMSIRVVREDGKPIDIGWAIARETFAKAILGLITGGLYLVVDYLWPLPDKQNRAIHDMIVKSRVIEV